MEQKYFSPSKGSTKTMNWWFGTIPFKLWRSSLWFGLEVQSLKHSPFREYPGYIYIYWVVPIPSNSHHQDFCIFRIPVTKPSFATAGKEDSPSCPCICRENLCRCQTCTYPHLPSIWTSTKNPTISLRSKVLEAHQKPLDKSTSDLRTMQHGWLIIPGIYLV